MRKLVALACGLSIGAAAHAQAGPSADPLQARLQKLAVAAGDLQKHLPNFACKETLVSQEIRGGKVKTQAQAAGDLRVERDKDGKPVEQFQPTQMNGRPVGPGPLKFPIYVSGGFKNDLDIFQGELQSCFLFKLSGNRLDFESSPDATTPGCKDHSDMHGFALLSGDDITHLERRVAEDAARGRNAVPFGSIDLSRVGLGDSSFLLSTHVIAELPKGKSTYRWEATYSECRLFQVKSTVQPVNVDEVPVVSGPAHP